VKWNRRYAESANEQVEREHNRTFAVFPDVGERETAGMLQTMSVRGEPFTVVETVRRPLSAPNKDD